MVLLASRLSTYAALGILLLIECYTSTFSPVVFAEDTSCSSLAAKFTLRCSLNSIGNVLLTATSLLLAARLLFGSCFSLVGPLLGAQGSFVAFFCFRLVAGPIAARSSWLVPSGLLRVSHFFKLASLSLNVVCSPFSRTLTS